MTGSTRLGKGAGREAGSEGSRCCNFGLDAQKSDQAGDVGNGAMDSDAQWSFGNIVQ